MLTPEEWVSQNFFAVFNLDKENPASLIAVEKEFFWEIKKAI